jgi:tetratricopeptide (TPR) repeat protein
MSFWRELWSEYRELAKCLVGTIFELFAILALIKVGGWLITWLNISPACSRGEWIECAHTVVLIVAWVGLLGSFIVVAAKFAYIHTVKRVKDMQLAIDLKGIKDYSSAIVAAVTSLEPEALDSDRVRAIEMLLEVRKTSPLDRKVNLFLGRLHRRRKDYDAAIEAMTFFIREKSQAGQTADKDYADLLYNRACYSCLRAAALGADDAGKRIENALADLAASIAISPENAADAQDDPDFILIKTDQRFVDLMENKKAP